MVGYLIKVGKKIYFFVYESQVEDDDCCNGNIFSEMDGVIVYGKFGKCMLMWFLLIMKLEM